MRTFGEIKKNVNLIGIALTRLQQDSSATTIVCFGPEGKSHGRTVGSPCSQAICIPLALGSYRSLLLLLFLPVLLWRLIDEENFLRCSLSGYADYYRMVRSRLIPGVW